jgi:DNA-binding GntR family transcriptional regulator
MIGRSLKAHPKDAHEGSRKENLKGKVYSILKERILEFELKPGERIQEAQLSENLGVSRTPIREALNKLEQEGFIKAFPNRGYFISDISDQEVEELYEVREVLESLAVRMAIKKGSQRDWTTLEEIISHADRGKAVRKTKDQRFEIGRRFHGEIARISGNATLQQMLSVIFEKIHRVRWVDIFLIDRADESLKEHIEILNQLKRGNAKEAIAATQKHIQHSKEKILHLLDRKKNFFYIT